MSHVYVSLGSNMGDRLSYLEQALEGLAKFPKTAVVSVSPYYETAAWGKTDQPDFLNVCACLETALSPEDFLDKSQALELELGRERHEHWGPRTVDIDLLLYDQLVLDSQRLIVPHPYLHQRAFVLVPLTDIGAEVVHPLLGKTIAELLQSVDTQDVTPYLAKLPD